MEMIIILGIMHINNHVLTENLKKERKNSLLMFKERQLGF